jgi:hypothetical protein
MWCHWGLGIGHIYSHEQYSDGSHSILANLIEPDDTSKEQANDPDLHLMEWGGDSDRGGITTFSFPFPFTLLFLIFNYLIPLNPGHELSYL